MKKNDIKELQLKTGKELEKLLKETQEKLTQLKLDHVQNKLKDTRSIFHTRKEIAVMQSIRTMKLKTEKGEATRS